MSNNHHHHSTTAATVAVCDSYINKEEQFKGRLQDSQKYCRMLCDRFRHADDNVDNNNMTGGGGGGGDLNIEALLLSIAVQAESSAAATDGDSDDGGTPFLTQAQVKSFFDKNRKRLKEAAEKNVATSRQVDNLIGSLRLLKQKVVQEEDAKMQQQQQQQADSNNNEEEEEEEDNNNSNNNSTNDDDELTNYETVIGELMEQHDANTPKLELWQESEYRKVCENLGEQLPNGGATGATGARGGNDADDDDDDIQFVPTAASQANILKCPITTMWMENPHKNKVCGHTYGFQAILQVMRQGGGCCRCPVAGCNNNNVTQQQLEKDIETEYAIKRRRRQEEHQSQQRASQADDVDDEEEEE